MANTKILIVDDDVNICELLRIYLEKEGFETEVETDGLRAVSAFNSFNGCLCICKAAIQIP